jgi:cytochrome P450
VSLVHVTTTHQQVLGRLFDPAVRPDPYPVLDALRESGPFTLMDGGLGVIGDHATCSRVLRDPAMSSRRGESRLASRRDRDAQDRQRSFLSLDPPDHTRLRRLVAKAFTARVIAGLEPRIQQITTELLDAAADRGELDVVPDLAYPLPVRIISELLGVPEEDQGRFEGWSKRLVRALDPSLAGVSDEEAAAAEAASEEFRAYFVELIARRRAEPTPDLLSRLVRIEEEGDQLTEEELLATCVLLLVAGHETTANLIANGVLALLRHPGQLAELRADPDLVPGAVEEVLRYDPPVQLTSRVVRVPTALSDDVEVPADGMLLLLLAAANRDPAAFADPGRFDIHRDARHHLSLAAGAHFCLGAPLARLEGATVLRAFATRVRSPELDEATLTYRPHVNLRGPDHLRVTFAGIR